jgi:hypothetical protein
MAEDTTKTSKSTDFDKPIVIPSDNPVDNDNAEEAAGGNGREKEIDGRDGPDPTRFGDWEKDGRCIDF